MKLAIVLAAIAAVLPLGRSTILPAPPPAGCVGCTPSNSQPTFSSGSCLTVTVTGNFALGTGHCNGEHGPCDPQPCSFADDCTITVTNGCGGPTYVKTQTNGDCDAGYVVIPEPGGDADPRFTISYGDGDPVRCGTSKVYRFYPLYPPTSGCLGGDGGWSYSCSGCGWAH